MQPIDYRLRQPADQHPNGPPPIRHTVGPVPDQAFLDSLKPTDPSAAAPKTIFEKYRGFMPAFAGLAALLPGRPGSCRAFRREIYMELLSTRRGSWLVVPVLLVAGSVGIACSGASDSSVVGNPQTDGGSGNNKGGGSGSDGGSSGGDTDGGTTGGDTDSGTGGGGTDSGPTGGGAPTWSTIYATYFASGTPGHCGNSGCHLNSLKGFKCGSDKTTCYNGLVTAGYVSGTSSALSDPKQSCLTWFGGNMPPGGGSSSAAQKDITAWVADGAKNN